MKLLARILNLQKKARILTTPRDYKQARLDSGQEIIQKIGREQFKKMVDRGLGVPVAYL